MRCFVWLVLLWWILPCAKASGAVVAAPGFKLDGRTASALSVAWWQWAESFPDGEGPVDNRTGANCALGQTGKVWFLAGGFGSSKIQRTCRIPAHKSIFFPVINMVYWRARDSHAETCKIARHDASLNNRTPPDLYVEVDGVPVKDVLAYRATTPKCFDLFKRVPSTVPHYNAYPSASDGFWILLRPLSKGTHTIKFGGKYHNDIAALGNMQQDIEYTAIVK